MSDMFFRILKKDLKRKRTMNSILLLFVIMAAMFLSGSVSNLITVSGAVEQFIELSNVPDFMTVSVTDGGRDVIGDFLDRCVEVKEYQIVDMFVLSNEQITVEKRAMEAEHENYERSATLAVCPVPRQFLKIFGADEEELTLAPGEIALPKVEAEKNNLQAGDRIAIQVGDQKVSFTVKEIVKDAVFGSTMMGLKRFYISDEDFRKFEKANSGYITKLYCVNYGDRDAFQREYKNQEFSTITNMERSMISACYIMDMLVSGVMIVVSICLILIAFLILRFTIVFTMQEDYKEIGIMKAIGIRDNGIRTIYLVKYFVISVVGSVIGLGLSFPFEKLLLKQAIVNIVIEHTGGGMAVNGICAVAVVAIVLLFCYGSTNKLKKFSAMEAIRSGETGERYQAKSKLRLCNCNRIRPYFYLGLNDIISSFRRFAVLGAIFCIGTMLILLPLCAVHTLKSEEMLRTMSIAPSDAFLENENSDQYVVAGGRDKLKNDMQEIRDTLKEHGWDTKVWAEADYTIPFYANDPDEMYSYLTFQSVGDDAQEYSLLEGVLPERSNEIMITDKVSEEIKAGIGDSLYYKINNTTQEFIITGIYQSMMNMGESMRVSHVAQLDETYMSGVFDIQVYFVGDAPKDVRATLEDLFPEMKIRGYRGFLDKMLGNTVEQVNLLSSSISVIVFIINGLITILMMKTLITKERGEIALLKCIGLNDGTIKAWQVCRILLILAAAILVGTLATKLLAPYIIGPIFGIMGAKKMHLVMNPLQTYVLYPMALLLITGTVAAVGAGEIKRVDTKEINNLE